MSLGLQVFGCNEFITCTPGVPKLTQLVQKWEKIESIKVFFQSQRPAQVLSFKHLDVKSVQNVLLNHKSYEILFMYLHSFGIYVQGSTNYYNKANLCYQNHWLVVDVFIAATRVISDQFKKNVADLRTTAVHIGTIEKSSRLKIFMKPVNCLFSCFWDSVDFFNLLKYIQFISLFIQSEPDCPKS